jgi:hypothetical protein
MPHSMLSACLLASFFEARRELLEVGERLFRGHDAAGALIRTGVVEFDEALLLEPRKPAADSAIVSVTVSVRPACHAAASASSKRCSAASSLGTDGSA